MTKKTTLEKTITGSSFYKQVAKYKLGERENLADSLILSGNIPQFLKKMKRINVSIFDSLNQKTIRAHYFVTPDYLSIGTNEDFARLPLSPMLAQRIADSFHCFLPTRKIVNDIYAQAKVKLEPQPLFAFRDSAPTFYYHHLIIEGQRQLKKGLIAGIKKDVVISSKIMHDARPNRVVIYGWHKLDGQPIQPLYTGHVNWYVDYSHGIRLVDRTIWVGRKKMDYTDVLMHPILRRLICDEDECNFYHY
ncbi:MAG: hypothetical protein JNL70_06650 [Saprospiraceae bacterium]|nr:hypothetical protein [Saprospiraceae bacterium]